MVEIELKSNELKEYLYLKLNKNRNTPLYDNDINAVEYLTMNGLDFLDEPTDITLFDLVFFNNLRECSILNKEISSKELDILKNLKKLNYLQLSNCKLPENIDLGVEQLIIDGCSGFSFENYKQKEKIKELRIINCEDIDMKGAAQLKNLTKLYLQNLNLKDIDEVKEIDHLQYLNLNGTKVEKLCSFDKNSKLRIDHESKNYLYDENSEV